MLYEDLLSGERFPGPVFVCLLSMVPGSPLVLISAKGLGDVSVEIPRSKSPLFVLNLNG
jgi:hypothetical protein